MKEQGVTRGDNGCTVYQRDAALSSLIWRHAVGRILNTHTVFDSTEKQLEAHLTNLASHFFGHCNDEGVEEKKSKETAKNK